MKKSTQPLNFANVGCIFKNPKGNSAGALIEQAGLKGLKIGDASVSTKHANFIINNGHAKSDDVIKLIDRIREAVYKNFGVNLELEVRLW